MHEAAMNVLQITRNLPPLQGGMERLNGHIARVLAEKHTVAVVGPEGCRRLLPARLDVAEVSLRPLPVFLLQACWQALRLAGRHRPAVVIAGSGLTAPMAWLAARRSGAQRIAYVHGLDLIVDSIAYRTFWLPFIRRMDLVLVNSANTGRLAQACGVAAARIRVLNPGTESPVASPAAATKFRHENGFGDRPLLLSVGRLTRRKGLTEFIERCLPQLCLRHPGLLLLVIGDDASNALKVAVGSERERIADTAGAAGVADALRFLPPCDDEMLSAAYEACDLHIFPVREMAGDVEGFGMVAIEAAAHGLPTIAFRSGGVPDAVIEGTTGILVQADDYPALVEAVDEWLPKSRDLALRARCREAARRWSWENFAIRLHQILAEVMPKGNAHEPRT